MRRAEDIENWRRKLSTENEDLRDGRKRLADYLTTIDEEWTGGMVGDEPVDMAIVAIGRLLEEVRLLRIEVDEAAKAEANKPTNPDFLDAALNEGDGTYRP